MLDQLLYFLPTRLQFPHIAQVLEHTGQGHPETLPK
jgi:hypothetical protein